MICQEYGLPVSTAAVPIFGQTGDNRYENVDKMILKQVDVLPHGLINNVEEKLGRDGGKLKEYIRWLAGRAARLKPRPDYLPTLHIDVYGTVGLIFGNDPLRVADYLAGLQADAGPHPLYIEGPVDMEEKPRQIEALRRIKERLRRAGSPVKIVADEWCNTLEDVIEFTDAGACHMVQIKTPDLGGIQDDRRERALLQEPRHGSLPGRHVQRDRGLRAVLRPPGHGRPARTSCSPSRAWASTKVLRS